MKIDAQHRCPYCNYLYPTSNRFSSNLHIFQDFCVQTLFYKCANPECEKKEFFVEFGAMPSKVMAPSDKPVTANQLAANFEAAIFLQRLLPQDNGGKPAYKVPEIPAPIFKDYDEACKIVQLSPRASATLSRRCIQHMIRHKFEEIKPGNLSKEIEALGKLKLATPVRQEIIDALDNARSLGNFGAHPEDDVDIIIDISKEEARKIIDVIEIVLHEWFIAPIEQEKRLAALKPISEQKHAEKKGQGS